MNRLRDKVAIVTGAASGLGAADVRHITGTSVVIDNGETIR